MKRSAGLDVVTLSPRDTRVCEIEASKHSVHASVVAPRGFRRTANLSMFDLRIQDFFTQTTSTFSCVAPITKPFLNIDHKIVRRQDTPRTCVQVMLPLVRNMRVVQILNPRNLLPCSCGLQGILQASQPSPVSQPRQLCLHLGCAPTSSSGWCMGDFLHHFRPLEEKGLLAPCLRSLGQRLTGRRGPVHRRELDASTQLLLRAREKSCLLNSSLRDVRRGLFFWAQKIHRSVTAKILLPDMFLRCDTRKFKKLRIFDGYRVVRQDAKKGPRSTMALDRRRFSSDSRASKDAT